MNDLYKVSVEIQNLLLEHTDNKGTKLYESLRELNNSINNVIQGYLAKQGAKVMRGSGGNE